MAKKQETKSKRQVVREQRAKRQRQQRTTWIIVITVAALAIAGLLIAPSIRNAIAPVGDIVVITPEARPQPNGTSMGDPNAPVKIDVWEDFQCPACRSFSSDVEPLIIQNYIDTGKVYYTFHQFPFIDDRVVTKESDQAANASMCAMEQGKFWEYHDMLFANWNNENAGAFVDKRLVAFAQALGLDMNQFNSCFKADKYKSQINQDLADGKAKGVTGTPSVFVNGTLLTPGYIPSYDQVSQAVDQALAGN